MEGLRIVPWKPDHAAALAKALEPPDELTSQVRDHYGPDLDGPSWRRTLVAELEGEPVGVATVFTSRWHPARLWACVEVEPAHRRARVGSALLDAARRRSSHDGRPLRSKVFAGSPGAHFARASGFRILQRSRTFRVPVAERPATSTRFVVDLSPAPELAASAFRDFYVRSHAWDPPGETTIADIRLSHVNEATATLLVLDPHGSALAVGCLYDEGGSLVLSGGPTTPGDQAAPGATAALLEAALAHARVEGQPELFVEADDSPPEVTAELERRGVVVLDEVHVVAEQ